MLQQCGSGMILSMHVTCLCHCLIEGKLVKMASGSIEVEKFVGWKVIEEREEEEVESHD